MCRLMRIYAKFHHEFECLGGKRAKDGSPSLIVPVLSPKRIYVSLHVGRVAIVSRVEIRIAQQCGPLEKVPEISNLELALLACS